MLSIRDWIWIACIVAGVAFTNGMLSSRVTALETSIKDLDLLLQYFEERERYEDCALILKVKEKVQTRQLLTKLQNNE